MKCAFLILCSMIAFDGNKTFAAEKIRILPLGDSLTEGGYNDNQQWYVAGGYRNFLKAELLKSGRAIDFVGRRKSGPVPENDVKHEGYSGLRIDEVAPFVREALVLFKPRIVLTILGSNDIIQNYETDSAPRRMFGLVRLILETSPGTVIYVGSPIPTNNAGFNAKLKVYAKALEKLVKGARDSRLRWVDMFWGAGIKNGDLIDGVHPRPSGWEKMGRTWARALEL